MLDRILASLADYLEYEADEGVTELELPAPPPPLAVERPARPAAVAAAAAPARPRRAAPPPTAAPPPRETESIGRGLERIAAEAAACTQCALHRSRRKTVPGQGCLTPEILFVGEGPGEDEDRTGLAFVGAAGQLLTRMLQAMGFTREQVFIANVVKCRPPGNRNPAPDEAAACLPYLRAQVALLKPKAIVALGAVATKALLGVETGITKLRGRWASFEGIALMPTYHPAYLLRSQGAKQKAAKTEAWQDLQAVLHRLGRPVPQRTERRKAPGAEA